MTIVNSVPAFSTAFTAFKAIVSAIIAASQQEDSVTSGIATDKKVSKQSLSQLAADIAAPIFAYASSIDNNTLKRRLIFRSQICTKQKTICLHPVVRTFMMQAQQILLPSQPLAPQPLCSLLYKQLPAKSTYARNAAALKKAIRENMKTLFKNADKILKEQMDKTLVGFKTLHLDFYSLTKQTASS